MTESTTFPPDAFRASTENPEKEPLGKKTESENVRRRSGHHSHARLLLFKNLSQLLSLVKIIRSRLTTLIRSRLTTF